MTCRRLAATQWSDMTRDIGDLQATVCIRKVGCPPWLLSLLDCQVPGYWMGC